MKALKRLALAALFAPVLFLSAGCASDGLEEVGEDLDEIGDDIEDAFD